MGTKQHRNINGNDMTQMNDNMNANSMLRLQSRGRVWGRIRDWVEMSRQRRALSKLNDELLKDIGVSRSDAMREAGRSFWDDRPDFDISLRQRGESDRMFAGYAAVTGNEGQEMRRVRSMKFVE